MLLCAPLTVSHLISGYPHLKPLDQVPGAGAGGGGVVGNGGKEDKMKLYF